MEVVHSGDVWGVETHADVFGWEHFLSGLHHVFDQFVVV